MTEKTTTRILLIGVLLVAYAPAACDKSTGQIQPSGNQARSEKPVSDEEIRLNNRKMGTVRDLSALTDELRRVFDAREKNNTLKKNKDGIYVLEKDVFLQVNPAVNVSTAALVLEELENAGAAPLLLSFETTERPPVFIPSSKPEKTKNADSLPKPDPLALVVAVGKTENDLRTDKGGIELILTRTFVPPAEADDKGLVIELRKDGEYLTGGRPVEEKMLENTFRGFLEAASGEDSKLVVVHLENNADKISFGSVFKVAREAHKAGFPKIELRIYAPPRAE